jgi:hypothetical protein
MKYRLEISPIAKAQMKTWRLAEFHDYLLVDINLKLRTVCENPTAHLKFDPDLYDGMSYSFSLVDPQNRLCEHRFVFQFVYSQDEQTLIVANAGYTRRIGI